MVKYNLQLFGEDAEAPEATSAEMTAAEETVTTETEATAEQSEAEEEGGAVEDKPTPDLNAIYANARRKAEAEFKSIQAKRDEEFVRRFGNYVNPETGARIQSEKDYFDALDAQERMAARQELEQAGVDVNMINRLVENTPAVKAANAYIESERQRQVVEAVNREVAEINKLNPNIKSFEDVPQEVVEMVTRGEASNLVNAYKVFDYGSVSKQREAAIKQETLNQVRGKQHLQPANGVSADNGMVEIPMEAMSTWRKFYPDLSLAELTKKFNAALKN